MMMNTDFPEERVLFCSKDVIVVNKTAGEATEGAGRGMIDLPALLKEYFAGRVHHFRPAAVHRLDVPVSGCALFAGNAGAAAFLSGVFSRAPHGEYTVEKRYWAAVELSPEFSALPETGELVHRIQTDIKKNKSTAYAKSGTRGKEAVLRYRIKGQGKNYGFMEIELVTGRHHQIRAQLAALGIHIKGDLKYGAKRSENGGGIRLHARSLSFPDPVSPKKIIRVTANPPLMDTLWEDFAAKQ